MNDDETPFKLQPPEPSLREEYNARKRAWRQANPDKIKATKQRCRDKNRARYLAQRHAHYEAHKEERKAYAKEYRLANPEKARAADKAYRENHKEEMRAKQKAKAPAKHLAKAYGMTPADVQAIQDSQDGRCPICKRPFNADLGGCDPCVDHEHATGRIRGVLCRLCNVGLGQIQDSPKLLRAAARYLDSHRA